MGVLIRVFVLRMKVRDLRYEQVSRIAANVYIIEIRRQKLAIVEV